MRLPLVRLSPHVTSKLQEICHQSSIAPIESNPVPAHRTTGGSLTGRQWILEMAIQLPLCLLLMLYRYYKETKNHRPLSIQLSAFMSWRFEPQNRRIRRQRTEYRSEKHCLISFENIYCSKFLARYCPSDSPPCGRVHSFDIEARCGIFKI